MSIKTWTSIQEGRFHLRMMKPGQTLAQYIQDISPPGERREALRRIAPMIRMAKAEAAAFEKARACDTSRQAIRYKPTSDPLGLLRIYSWPRSAHGCWYAAAEAEAVETSARLLKEHPDIRTLDIVGVSGRCLRRVHKEESVK